VARRQERLELLSAQARAAGQAAIHPLVLDVNTPGAAARIAAEARALGGASWLVNDAGFGLYGQFESADPGRLGEMIRTNCEALVLVTHALLPDLRAAGREAAILNVASLGGLSPMPYMAVYGATKAFVVSFSEALAEELRPAGIRVTAFCPGPVATEFAAVAGTARRFENVPGIGADDAAREALDALVHGEVLRVTRPLTNWLAASLTRLLPRALVRRASERILRPAEGR
jgi:short-subunit dehydrogenase